MVIQGNKDTLSVRLSDTLYHVRSVVAGAPESFVIADMPYASYQTAPSRRLSQRRQATRRRRRHGQNGRRPIPRRNHPLPSRPRRSRVCAHVGLMPQSVRASGGYRVQGRKTEEVQRITQDALAAPRSRRRPHRPRAPLKDGGQKHQRIAHHPTIGIGSGVDLRRAKSSSCPTYSA